MEPTSRILLQDHQDDQGYGNNSHNWFLGMESKLQESLPFPWIAVGVRAGIHVMLLSRSEEKTVQRRVHISQCGAVKITVHCKPIPAILSEAIIKHDECDNPILSTKDRLGKLLKRILAIVKRLQTYEVCVGIDNIEFKPLWALVENGRVDDNPFKELRYNQSFRPFECHLLVSTSGYLKRHCSVCTQMKARFRAKLGRYKGDISGLTTPNLYLSRHQLLQKVQVQEKKLKSNRAQLAKLKADLQQASSKKNRSSDDNLSADLLKICMNYVQRCD